MVAEDWQSGTLWDDQGQYALALIRYDLFLGEERAGLAQWLGRFVLEQEYAPLHTGLAELRDARGARRTVRIRRISRPQGEGELEVIPGP
jgi:hypothetical protein